MGCKVTLIYVNGMHYNVTSLSISLVKCSRFIRDILLTMSTLGKDALSLTHIWALTHISIAQVIIPACHSVMLDGTNLLPSLLGSQAHDNTLSVINLYEVNVVTPHQLSNNINEYRLATYCTGSCNTSLVIPIKTKMTIIICD